MDGAWVHERFAEARVARLGTVDAAGRPHLVPIVFTVLGGGLYSAVDAKPKRSPRLGRLADIRATGSVSVLVDAYRDDWAQLWWARADGTARILDLGEPGSASESTSGREAARAVRSLIDRYPQYERVAITGPVIAVDVTRWSGWSAAETG